MSQSAQEKTEKATPRKRQDARKKGQVAKSQDLTSALNLLALVSTIYLLQNYFTKAIYNYMESFYSNELSMQFSDENIFNLFQSSLLIMLSILGPIFLVAVLIGLIGNIGQVGFMFSPEVIKPKLSKINPIEGFKKIFSLKSLVELVKSLMKIIVVSFAVYLVVKANLQDLIFTIDMEPMQIYSFIGALILKVCLTAAVVFLIIAALDYMYQRYDHEKNLRMSIQEIRDEFKQMEGDPYIKGKRREKQRAMTMNRMIQAIPEATVVVTNPTHLSIALKYKAGEFDTPVIVAKGAGTIALKIREIATEHEITIIENKPVAQMLYRNAEIGDEIPMEVYQAVAEILAMVFRIKGKL